MQTKVDAQDAGQSGEEKPDLDRLYKPVGIAAVTAASICVEKKKVASARSDSRD